MSKKRNRWNAWPVRLVGWILSTAVGLICGIIETLGSVLELIALSIFKKVKVTHEVRKLHSTKHYNDPAMRSELELVKPITGEFNIFTKALHRKSLIMLIFGKRGSGKSALGFRLLENIYAQTGRTCYVLGVKQSLVPGWIHSIEDIETATDGGVILVDEGAVSFSARESMSQHNKELARLMAIARHKDLSLIFITQNTGMIDKNVLKLTDTLFVKEGSLLQLEMERTEIRKFYAKAKPHFDKVPNKVAHVYIIDSDFEGFAKYNLPSFWDDSISKSRST